MYACSTKSNAESTKINAKKALFQIKTINANSQKNHKPNQAKPKKTTTSTPVQAKPMPNQPNSMSNNFSLILNRQKIDFKFKKSMPNHKKT